MRVIFMGTPGFALPTLAETLGQGHEVVAVYSQPARRAGRGMAPKVSAVHEFAERAGIPVLTPSSLSDDRERAQFSAFKADVAVVVAYGLILPREILEAPVHGCLNLHASLLPRWRGAAPIHRAIMAGDGVTGVCVMRMDEGLDTGPVCLAERVPIAPDVTSGDLHDVLAGLGGSLMARALAALDRDSLDCTPQPESGATYAAKIGKTEARIDFSRPASDVHNHIRGLSPRPGAWFELPTPDGPVRVKVLRGMPVEESGPPGTVLDEKLTIACGKGAIRPLLVQRQGKAVTDVAAFLRGRPVPLGTRLATS